MVTATAILAAAGLATLSWVILSPSRWRADASTPGSIIVIAGLMMCLLALLLSIISGVLAWAAPLPPNPHTPASGALKIEEADRG